MRKEFVVSNRNGDSWRFQPNMKETPSTEGAFLVSETPRSGRHRGGVLVTVVVWLPSPVVSPTLNVLIISAYGARMMLCPECGAYGYSRNTKTPEWRCSENSHEWGRRPEPSGSSRSSFDSSPTAWGLVVDTSLICRRRVYGQNRNADAWAAPGDIGKRFRYVCSYGRTTRRCHLRRLGNNCPVGWTYLRYVRQKAGAPDRGFAYGLRSVGIRCGMELWFLTGHTAHRWRRNSHASHDHDGGVGRQLTA